ncbi:hypothetical protein [Muricoccus pecuniae]|uniref:Uncharacterized protein n=1 Tax=Muricoccus pecuniae TaxID=693023 RepID=A0A840Y9U5_9PROT|nr:hypothetical protein [Roseomonas pecuniae]MBB5695489.1 hypothetical protein [Roseomonas pecuniae]
MAITTPGAAGATCRVTGGDGLNETVVTPAMVRIARSRRNVSIACTLPDGRTADRTISPSYSDYSYVQLPVGYLVDSLSGAMWTYPSEIGVEAVP